MVRIRYTAWDGTQRPQPTAEQVFERYGDLLGLTDDARHALEWLLRQGFDWDGEHVLTSSPVGSVKGGHARANGHVSVSVVDPENPWRYAIIRGKVTDIVPDEGLAFIDKMSERYVGRPYMRRGFDREVFVITPTHIRVSMGRG